MKNATLDTQINWFKPVLGALVVEVYFLIALGGFVRIMNAGLACPDWPLCFGDYVPDFQPQVYLEFIHRAMAGLVTLTSAALLYGAWTAGAGAKAYRARWQMSFAFVLLLAQVAFGALTVLWQLKAGVVAAHLGLGTAFFALLLWMYLEQKGPDEFVRAKAWVTPMVSAVTLALYGQLLLGGLVASNYAGNICSDFPTCNGQWFPTFSGPIGLQVLHRLGAYFMFVLIFANWRMVRRGSPSPHLRDLSRLMFVFVCLQVMLGISNVVFKTPPIIGVLHLGTAIFILSLGIRQIYFSVRRAREIQPSNPNVSVNPRRPPENVGGFTGDLLPAIDRPPSPVHPAL